MRRLAALLLLAGCATPRTAPDALQPRFQEGRAHFMPPGSDVWFVAKPSRPIEHGTRLRTQEGAAVIALPMATAALGPDTRLSLDDAGSLYLSSGTVGVQGLLTVRGAAGFASSGAGSVFSVEVSSASEMEIRCSSGTVTVRGSSGSEERLVTGASTRLQPEPEPQPRPRP